jgi:putative methyltransferase
MKKLVYFNEFNIPTDNTIYFPYSSGLLRAYAEKNPVIRENFAFAPFLFKREPVEVILSKYVNPSVACFSSSLWNHRLNLKVAKLVKEKFPDCLIVFGGPQIEIGRKLYEENPFIDIGVFGEGEIPFTNILLDLLNGDVKKYLHKTYRIPTPTKDIDSFPSPYSSGLFDYMIEENPDVEFKVITETNRNCPFNCAFCFYGQSSIDRKISYHSVDYIRQEVEWIAAHKIKYVFCADANFGMFKRDIEIAQLYAKIKKSHGYPEKFRVCYGKNASETIFQTASVLFDADLAKTVTLAVQSTNQQVLENITRTNIKQDVFRKLQLKYTEAGMPTYTEIIFALPGETYDTFKEGLEFILEASQKNQVFIYHCQLLPNTPMSEPEYIKKFGIKTVHTPLAEVHGNLRDNSIEQEYEDVVISTNSMDVEMWKRGAILAWMVQLFYSLKIADEILGLLHSKHGIKYTEYLEYIINRKLDCVKYFAQIAEDVIQGKKRCQIEDRFGVIYYEPEEIAFLNICLNKEFFYLQRH